MSFHLKHAYTDMGSPIGKETCIPCNESGIPAPIIMSNRRTGNTTRLVDYYIQELFINYKAEVVDHYPEEKPRGNGMTYLMQRIVQRLQNEHRMDNKDFTVGNVRGVPTIIINDPSKFCY